MLQLLKDKIINEGTVLPGNILKVDGFLNQQIDIGLLNDMGREFSRLFAGCGVNKILTVEASGIALACITAQYFNNAPVVFGKKHKTLNRDASFYSTPIFSFTHNVSYDVTIAKKHLSADDKVLIIDDFLASGEAIRGLMDLVRQAGAVLVGAGIAIEKGFQGGGDELRKDGIRVESLAVIEHMDDCAITFRS